MRCIIVAIMLAALVALAMLLVSGMAAAITYGQPDGN
jgi:hypothetical protein